MSYFKIAFKKEKFFNTTLWFQYKNPTNRKQNLNYFVGLMNNLVILYPGGYLSKPMFISEISKRETVLSSDDCLTVLQNVTI